MVGKKSRAAEEREPPDFEDFFSSDDEDYDPFSDFDSDDEGFGCLPLSLSRFDNFLLNLYLFLFFLV